MELPENWQPLPNLNEYFLRLNRLLTSLPGKLCRLFPHTNLMPKKSWNQTDRLMPDEYLAAVFRYEKLNFAHDIYIFECIQLDADFGFYLKDKSVDPNRIKDQLIEVQNCIDYLHMCQVYTSEININTIEEEKASVLNVTFGISGFLDWLYDLDQLLKSCLSAHISLKKTNNTADVDKSQNFLNEIKIVEHKIANNGNDQFRKDLFAPYLYEPIATLWKTFEGEGSKETKDLFREAVEEYVNNSKLVAEKLVNDYEKERKKQPERGVELLIENRDWYVKRLADVYVPIDNWYHNFYDEKTQVINDINSLESEIFLFCYHSDKPFMVGLRLLRDLYGYYRAIDIFNDKLFQVNNQNIRGTTASLSNGKKIKVEVDTLDKCFEHTSKYIKVMEILSESDYCDSLTHIWKDRGAGYKGLVVELIKYLHTQGYYGNNNMPTNSDIILIAKNTFGVDLGIDIVKRTKPGQSFKFIGPASTQ